MRMRNKRAASLQALNGRAVPATNQLINQPINE
jgi:hypothetical protein